MRRLAARHAGGQVLGPAEAGAASSVATRNRRVGQAS
jgi:hypothetical protein